MYFDTKSKRKDVVELDEDGMIFGMVLTKTPSNPLFFLMICGNDLGK